MFLILYWFQDVSVLSFFFEKVFLTDWGVFCIFVLQRMSTMTQERNLPLRSHPPRVLWGWGPESTISWPAVSARPISPSVTSLFSSSTSAGYAEAPAADLVPSPSPGKLVGSWASPSLQGPGHWILAGVRFQWRWASRWPQGERKTSRGGWLQLRGSAPNRKKEVDITSLKHADTSLTFPKKTASFKESCLLFWRWPSDGINVAWDDFIRVTQSCRPVSTSCQENNPHTAPSSANYLDVHAGNE